MAAPVIVSATLNKTSYAKGETMILTVVAQDTDEGTFEVTVVVMNKVSGAKSEPITVTAIVDELAVSVTDSSGRVWTLQGRAGSTWTFSAVA